MKILLAILIVMTVTAKPVTTAQQEKPLKQLNQSLDTLNQKSDQLLLLTQKLRS